jgi:hypothetical protein
MLQFGIPNKLVLERVYSYVHTVYSKPRDINRDLRAYKPGSHAIISSLCALCGLVSRSIAPLLHPIPSSFLNPTPYSIIMNRNLLLSLALFLALAVATFLSVHCQLSSRLKQRKQIELEDNRVFEQEILRREQDWAEMEMTRYEQARGLRPVRSEEGKKKPTPQTKSSLRGSSNDETKAKKKSVTPF